LAKIIQEQPIGLIVSVSR